MDSKLSKLLYYNVARGEAFGHDHTRAGSSFTPQPGKYYRVTAASVERIETLTYSYKFRVHLNNGWIVISRRGEK